MDNGADIISMSYGSEGYSRAEEEALSYAYWEGVTLFAAASFSTHNSSVDLSAPGVSVMSTMPTYTVALNGLGCTRNYSFMSGTSMACPIAAGVAALILSQKPNLDPDWWWR